MSNSCRFQSVKIWSQRKRLFSKKNPKINAFVVKTLLESNFKSLCQSAVREHFSLNPQTQLKKKLILLTEATIPINTMKWKGSCNQFPSFMSEPSLSTRSRTCMHLKISRFFLVFAGQKHISGTHRATNEQVHYQATLTSFKAQLLEYTK